MNGHVQEFVEVTNNTLRQDATMRIAIIGATQLLGPATAKRLMELGHDVFWLHRGAYAAPHGVCEIVAARDDQPALSTALQRGFDAVIDTRAANAATAQAVRTALGNHASRLVVLSSHDIYAQFAAVLGHPPPLLEAVITESSALGPPFPFIDIPGAHSDTPDYGKLAVERIFMNAPKLPTTVLRIPATFGPNDPKRRFGAWLESLESAAVPRSGGAQWRWTHGYIDNVADAIALAALDRRTTSHTYNVGEAETPTMGERMESLAAAAGMSLHWEDVPNDALPEALGQLGKMCNDIVVSSASIRSDLGFVERATVDEAMRGLVCWLRR